MRFLKIRLNSIKNITRLFGIQARASQVTFYVEYAIINGRANAILLPYVIEYNSSEPTKFVSFPKYEYFIADIKYVKLAERLGLDVKDTKTGVNALVKVIQELMEKLEMPKSLKEAGIDEKEFLEKLDELAENSFEDQCTGTNPRLPLIAEMKEILLNAYYGR